MASRAKKRAMMRNQIRADSRVAELRPPKAAASDSEILIYGDIGESFWDEDGGITAKAIKAALDAMPSGADVVVRINSPGGDAFEGVAIGNILRSSNRRVVVMVDGTAISAASVIAMAGDEIRMADNALMMIHDPWTIAIGDASEMRDTADKLDKIAGALAQTYVTRTGKSMDEIRALMAAETWMDAQEALDGGFATHIDGASDAEALLTERKIAAYGNVPGSARRWVRGNGDTNLLTAKNNDLYKMASAYGVTVVDSNGDALIERPAASVIVTQDSPPADTERGGIHTNIEVAMDLTEIQAALTDATAKVAKLTEDVGEANARGDMLEAQNAKLAEERDAVKAKLAEIDEDRLTDKVKALVGVKFGANEYDEQLAVAKLNEELFDKLVAQRSDMTLLNRDPAKIGADPAPKRAGTNTRGEGFAEIVTAAANTRG